VTVRFGTVPDTLGPDAERLGPHELTPGAVLVSVPGMGRFWVHDGKEIVVAPDPQAGDDDLRLVLSGMAITVLLHQRGLLALHASAVATPGGSIVFAGAVGAGKSMLATACCRQGYPILTDDICVIAPAADDGALRVRPGHAHVRLWPEALSHFQIAPASLPRVHPLRDKRVWPAEEAFFPEPRPLRSIYVVSGDPRPISTVVPLSGADKITALTAHVCRSYFLVGSEARARHFARLAAVAQQTPIFRLERSDDLGQLEPLIARLAADWQ